LAFQSRNVNGRVGGVRGKATGEKLSIEMRENLY